MNCKNCGAILNEGEKFCGQCGTAIEVGNTSNQQSNVTEWQQSSVQSQPNQQYQYGQANQQYQYNQQTQGQQQYQQNPQPYKNQKKSKSGKTILIIVLCIIIIPVILFLMLFLGLGIFIFNSAADSVKDVQNTVKNVQNTVTGTYDTYNWMNNFNQTIDNPPSYISGSENTVKLKGYTLTIPSTVQGKANTLNTQVDLTSKDNSWIGQITTSTVSYDTLKEQKEQASALLSRMVDGENAKSSDLKTETIGGVEYLLSEISSSEGTGLLCYTELNSTTTAIVVIYNTDGTASRNALTDVSKILRSAK